MIVRDVVKISLDNLNRRKIRTILTTSGVIVGILTIVTMVSLGVGVQESMINNLRALGMETVVVQPATAERNIFNQFAPEQITKPLTPAAVAELGKLEGIAEIHPEIDMSRTPAILQFEGREIGAFIASSSPVRFVGPLQPVLVFAAGRDLEPDEQTGIVIGDRHLSALGVGDASSIIGKEITVQLRQARGDHAEFPVKVVGVRQGPDSNIRLGIGDRVKMKAWWYNKENVLETDGYDLVTIRASSVSRVSPLAKQVDSMGFKTQTLTSLIDLANRMFAIMQTMLASVGVLALFVASLGIVNTMIMAIYERTREIGILKALGASRGDILRLFMVEAAMIGLMGGVVGLFFGWLLGLGLDWVGHQYVASQGITINDPFFLVNWWLIVGALIFATLVGLLAGIYPAARAAKLDPITALHHE